MKDLESLIQERLIKPVHSGEVIADVLEEIGMWNDSDRFC
jgi:hypothetical protein